MLRMFLVVFAWPLLLVIASSVWLWYTEEFPEPPRDQLLDEYQVRIARDTADTALERMRAIPAAEQYRVMTALRAALTDPSTWLRWLQSADHRIICLGEHHEPSTRRFLAETFFRRYRVDVLLLEATPAQMQRIHELMDRGREYVPLLDADIRVVLESARRRNPDLVVRGIEETRAQIEARAGREGSRDRSLVRNFWRAWEPGKRNVILYGALHCADESIWLFHHLRQQLPPRADVPMRSVRVIGTGQHRSTLAFTFFLQALGLADGDFVIPETAALPAEVRRWFPIFNQQVLARFPTLVIFHNSSEEIAAARAAVRERAIRNAPGSGDVLPQWIPAR